MTYQNFVTNQRLSHAIKSSHFKIWLQKRELRIAVQLQQRQAEMENYTKREMEMNLRSLFSKEFNSKCSETK